MEAKQQDVAIKGDRIAAIGDLSGDTAGKVIDASGLTVTPGFIDVHSHAAPGLKKKSLSAAHSILANGVTTVMISPDGQGPLDLKEERAELEAVGVGVNVAQLIGHGSIRKKFFGTKNIQPTARQLEEMKAYVQQAMEDGAYGMSSGPFYAAGFYSTTEELIELSKVAAAYGGLYTSHIRDESSYTIGVEKAVEEVITISREAGITGIITHIKCLGPEVWDKAPSIVEKINQARAEGLEVYADQYPYEASSTGFNAALFPRDPLEGEALREAVRRNLQRRGGPQKIGMNKFAGRRLSEVIKEMGKDPITAIIEINKKGGGSIVSYNMSPENKSLFMKQPWTMTCSDGGLHSLVGDDPVHPRNFGAFARKIRKYVVEDKIIDLPTAIRSMTGLAAEVCHIEDRGFIRPGAYADLLVFDPLKVKDKATFD
ncbi:MAG: amidohydrolase family protein, partial [Planctomycetes bacterium]|nr:amidohydrolase family protein [Planctomycetota bacterium]